MGFQMPPHRLNPHGHERRVGFELEFAGRELGVEGAARAVMEQFGGRLGEGHAFEAVVEGAEFGDFSIVVDARVLRDRRYRELLEGMGMGLDELDRVDWEQPIERLLGWLAETIVPLEVTTPPIPLSELARVEELRLTLAARKARGTGARLRYAFGLHINPEAPALEADSITRHLRAFLALYERLLEGSDIDLARTLSPFIDPFPDGYRSRVLALGYAPDLDALAADYVEHNPTRNRPLDLLPLLTHLIGEAILADVEHAELLRPRPAFHYRLPNCRIDEPRWSVAEEWNRWVEVERLADRPEALERACAEALESSTAWDRVKERARRAVRGDEG